MIAEDAKQPFIRGGPYPSVTGPSTALVDGAAKSALSRIVRRPTRQPESQTAGLEHRAVTFYHANSDRLDQDLSES
jgi:hypothetical protein